ncbi:MAG: hypothetical protein LBC09_01340 [Helicobacteraceae bacterium]|nr:hypothetical protein [Helicobacteraceae bacterium]
MDYRFNSRRRAADRGVCKREPSAKPNPSAYTQPRDALSAGSASKKPPKAPR